MSHCPWLIEPLSSPCARFWAAILDQQKKLLDQQTAPSSCAGASFERDIYGMYFFIREKGTGRYLSTWGFVNTEGTQVQIWPRENGSSAVLKSMVLFCFSVKRLQETYGIDMLGVIHRQFWSGAPRCQWFCGRHCWWVF